MEIDADGWPVVLDARDIGKAAEAERRVHSSSNPLVRFLGTIASQIEVLDRHTNAARRPEELVTIINLNADTEAIYLARTAELDELLAAKHWTLSNYRPGNPNPTSNFDDYGPAVQLAAMPISDSESYSFS